MALRDTWHRFLVYFGLAEEYDEDDRYGHLETVEQETAERPRERTGVRRLSSVTRRRRSDDFDDIFADDEPAAAPPPRGRSGSLRAVGNGDGGNVNVHLVIPRNFNDAQQIADQFKRQVPVILNLQSTDGDLSKRLIDFSSGLTYALDGGMQRVAEKVFMLTPRNVEVSAEEQARLLEKGFFNQS